MSWTFGSVALRAVAGLARRGAAAAGLRAAPRPCAQSWSSASLPPSWRASASSPTVRSSRPSRVADAVVAAVAAFAVVPTRRRRRGRRGPRGLRRRARAARRRRGRGLGRLGDPCRPSTSRRSSRPQPWLWPHAADRDGLRAVDFVADADERRADDALTGETAVAARAAAEPTLLAAPPTTVAAPPAAEPARCAMRAPIAATSAVASPTCFRRLATCFLPFDVWALASWRQALALGRACGRELTLELAQLLGGTLRQRRHGGPCVTDQPAGGPPHATGRGP